jgi:hypothetical protein
MVYQIYSPFIADTYGWVMKLINISAAVLTFAGRFGFAGIAIASIKKLVPSTGITAFKSGLSSIIATASPA